MKTKVKKYARIPKYPAGGSVKTQEQIDYEEYLAKTGRTPETQKAIEEGQEQTITSSKKQIGDNKMAQDVIRNTASSYTPYAAAAYSLKDIVGNALIKTEEYDPETGQTNTVNKGEISRGANAAIKPSYDSAVESFNSGNTLRGIADLTGFTKVGNIYDAAFKKNTVDDILGKNDNPERDLAIANKKKEDELKRQQKFYEDKSYLNSYNVRGNEGIEYYNAKGGKIRYELGGEIEGGKRIALSSDVDIVTGKTHSEGGITLKNNGKAYAEVEDQEVLKDTKTGENVYSDRLEVEPGVTYASAAEKLGKEKGKHEMNLKSTNLHSKGTAQRMTERLDSQLNSLFNHQEMMKKANIETSIKALGGNIKKYAWGDTTYYVNQTPEERQARIDEMNNQTNNRELTTPNPYENERSLSLEETNTIPTSVQPDQTRKGKTNQPDYGKALDFAFGASNFMDNYYNSKLINETAEVPKPHLQAAAKLETNYNIEPALNENRVAYSDFAKGVDSNLSSGNVAASNKFAAYAKRLENNNRMYGQKANIETNLINQSRLNAQDITGKNLAKLDKYDIDKYNRELMLKGEKSANIANVSEDIGKIGTERQLRNLDDKKVVNTIKAFDNNDAAAYKNYNEVYDNYKRTGKLNDLKESMSKSKSKSAIEAWNKDPRNKNNQIVE